MVCADKVFSSISGVWIFGFFFVSVFSRRALCFFAWENFSMNRPLVFFLCVFFRGSFSKIWCLDFWFSVDSDSCVCAHLDFWSKKHGIAVRLRYQAVSMTWHFRSFGPDGLCGPGFFFSISGVWILEFFFVIFFQWVRLCFFAWGYIFDESTLVFFSGVFWQYLVFGFLVFSRFRLLRMRASRFLVQKARNCCSLEISASFHDMTF